MRLCFVCAAGLLLPILVPFGTASEVDRLLREENASRNVQVASQVDDLSFLRRVTVDLIGRIPTGAEIKEYENWPAAERRARLVDNLLKHERFADRWSVFFGDMFRVRYNSEGGAAFQAFVHRALEAGVPYDVMCRQLLTASGKAGASPEVGFVLGDNADPMALAGVTSQVFLGIRISCAQCHNHPFDVWTRKEFYGLAAFFGQTRRVESRLGRVVYVQEDNNNRIMWPPDDKDPEKARSAMKPTFPFVMDKTDGPGKHLARLTAKRLEEEARRNKSNSGPNIEDLLGAADNKIKDRTGKEPADPLASVVQDAQRDVKNLRVQDDIYGQAKLRLELAKLITDPRNRFFSRNLANRVWGELLGRGFINPIDDYREDNQPSHPKTLDYLADEFVASGYDLKSLVRLIVLSDAYQKAHLPTTTDPLVRMESEKAFAAATVRRMLSEVMYDSIIQAGHLFEVKHRPNENLVTVRTTVREAIELADPKNPEIKNLDKPKPVTSPKVVMPGYDLERSIEVDFKSVLAKKDMAPSVEAMQAMSNEEIEAMQMMQMERPGGKRMKYIERVVESKIDDNPRYTSALRMAHPAPEGHFLRVFGQPSRATLDDRREHSPSMRQALMILNGKLTHESARVGTLEPLHKILTGPTPDLDQAIRLAYLEILTREPGAEEIKEAKTILQEANSPVDGMADLRWALFNSHAFRFLP